MSQVRKGGKHGPRPRALTSVQCVPTCDLVLPCRDEGPALRGLLPRVPDTFSVIVVDNGSRDDTAAVARELGARVVTETSPGLRRRRPRRHRGRHRRLRRGDGRRRLLRPRPAPAAARRRRVRPRRHRRGSTPSGPARRLAVARAGRQRADHRLAPAPDRDGRPRHRPDAGVPTPGAARPRPAGPPVRLPRRAAPGRHPRRLAGLASTTSTTTPAPRARSRRCPAR